MEETGIERQMRKLACPECQTPVWKPLTFENGTKYLCGSYPPYGDGCGTCLIRDAPGEPWNVDADLQPPERSHQP